MCWETNPKVEILYFKKNWRGEWTVENDRRREAHFVGGLEETSVVEALDELLIKRNLWAQKIWDRSVINPIAIVKRLIVRKMNYAIGYVTQRILNKVGRQSEIEEDVFASDGECVVEIYKMRFQNQTELKLFSTYLPVQDEQD